MKSDMRDMKDSGVEWLGEIPGHWRAVALGAICECQGGFAFPLNLQGRVEGELPFYKVSDMNAPKNKVIMRVANNYISRSDLLGLKAKTTRRGATVFPKIGAAIHTNKKRTLGTEAVIDNNMLSISVRNRQMCTDEYLYLFLTGINLSSLVQEGPVPTIAVKYLLRRAFPLPPLDEQRAIASYLDSETAKLDALIAKSQRLIDLLREKRTALISAVVTRGLDANVEMRDSGVEWLGEIPGHWEVKRLKYVVEINPKKSQLKYSSRELEVSFTPMEAIGERGELDPAQVKPIRDVFHGYTFFGDDDVIVAKITPCFENGKGAIARNLSNGIGFGTTELFVLRPSPYANAEFIYYLTVSARFRNMGIVSMQGAAGQQRVTDLFIRDYRLPLPPLDEQRAIASYLDHETAKLDALIAKSQRLIDLLREKRTALISAAVTGKISVDPSPPPAPPQSIGEGSLQSSECL